tara:strand:+ start:356 stop:718 length:363 start_codon:yes stop_codon:yes gene_type:complete
MIIRAYKEEDLLKKVYDLIARTSIELGYNTKGKDMAVLSKIFANDLIKERRFQNLTFEDIDQAFHIGVRFSKEQQYLNIPTFYKWVIKHKKTISEHIYNVETLNQKKEDNIYYKEQKLLK